MRRRLSAAGGPRNSRSVLPKSSISGGANGDFVRADAARPQTLGEIKGRTERMYGFADLEEVELVLHKLAAREDGALTQKLPASPGMKEPRYAQTLGGPVEFVAPAVREAGGSDRLTALEVEVAKLREELTELRRRLDEVLG